MASLLVFLVDDHNPDPYKDVKALKRGDVLEACADDYQWSRTVLNDPRFRVLVFPSASLDEASVLLSPELATKPTVIPDPMLQLRGFRLRIDDLPAAAVIHQPLAAFIEQKAPIPDPNVIG